MGNRRACVYFYAMDIYERYLNLQKDQFAKSLDLPVDQVSIFVIIPCFNEPDILPTLNSLASCIPPDGPVSVIVVVNDSTNSDAAAVEQNRSTLEAIANWQFQHPNSFFHLQRLYAYALPEKWAGVGWARKLGMDEAIKQIAKNHSSDGIICSLDADSTILPNYLQIVERTFRENPLSNFFTIHFEHPYYDPELGPLIREGIIRYELHMRYFRQAMVWCGYPHAIHTVGSSFALKASAYVRQGGMNRRKAGEDFYFLHKLVLLGHYGNISGTTVFPASRISDRVPFGTGAAIKKWMEGGTELYTTYSLEAFGHLKPLFAHSSRFWTWRSAETGNFFNSLTPALRSFCENSNSLIQLLELKSNCSTEEIFEKRFFHLFNAFWILKYLNFVHEASLTRTDLKTEALRFLHNIGIELNDELPIERILEIFRDLDKQNYDCIPHFHSI